MIRILTAFTVLALSSGLALAERPSVSLEIKEWAVPYDEPRTRDPWVGGEDLVWFVGQRTHFIGQFRPKTSTVH